MNLGEKMSEIVKLRYEIVSYCHTSYYSYYLFVYA